MALRSPCVLCFVVCFSFVAADYNNPAVEGFQNERKWLDRQTVEKELRGHSRNQRDDSTRYYKLSASATVLNENIPSDLLPAEKVPSELFPAETQGPFGEFTEWDGLEDNWFGNITCDLCKFAIDMVQKLVAAKSDKEMIMDLAIELCQVNHIETDRVCTLIVHQYTDMILGVVEGTVLNPDEICGFILGDTCAVPYNPVHIWNISISSKPKPPVRPHVPPKPGSPTLRVLHLTDLHLDTAYLAGADDDCGEPLCCRAYDLYPAPNASRRAGEFGDYKQCDTSYKTLEALFSHLADIRDQFDFIIFTGDIAAHDMWNQTRAQQLAHLQILIKLLRTYLPDKPVYPCPGNHEGVPGNSFPPDTIKGQSMEWLYSAYLESWGYWLPANVSSTILRGGFYTFSPYPGFRIVSLNSNYGARLNWWLIVNSTDPQGQLQWLSDVLQEAEDKGEKVHILSHHPPGTQMKAFNRNYYSLIHRYESTITGQFHGHTHKDEFEVFYDHDNTTRAMEVSYVAGSISTYTATNPAYRIYTIDGNYNNSSWEILDYTHYYMDIPTANSEGKATWVKEYTPLQAYQMPNLYPQAWGDLVYRMKNNETLFQQFYTYFRKSAESGIRCGKLCKNRLLCRFITSGSGHRDPKICAHI